MKPPKYFYFRVKTDSKATKIVLEDASDCDVVEVVRCKDCKYRAEDDFCTGRGWPMGQVPDDGYCDHGKRKDGGQGE